MGASSGTYLKYAAFGGGSGGGTGGGGATSWGSIGGTLSNQTDLQSALDAKQALINPGNITTTTTGLTVGNGTSATFGPATTVDVQTASSSQPGLISAASFTSFNNKAERTLNNLQSTQINSSLLFDTDIAYSVGSPGTRALQSYSSKFVTTNDTGSSAFCKLTSDALNGNPGIVFGATSAGNTFVRIYISASKTIVFDYGGVDVLTFNAAGINSATGGQWGAFNGSYNYLNLQGAFSWNDVQSNVGSANFTVTDGRCFVFVNSSATVSALTITMPPTPLPNMPLTFSFQSAVTSLTLNPNSGQAFIASSTYSPAAGSAIRLISRGADSKWWPA